MKNFTVQSCLCLLLSVSSLGFGQESGQAQDKSQDLLHFLNGDYLHGSFAGMEDAGKVRWQHPDIAEPVEIDTGKLRRIALQHAGKSLENVPSSYVQLHNGDRIPGEILALDKDSVRIAPSFADDLIIPRDEISRLCPSPHGGKLFYYGPFSREKWTILNEKGKNPEAEILPLNIAPAEEKQQEDSENIREDEWVFSGAAWYNSDDTPIALAGELPDRTAISFNLAWKNRLNATIAFHATLVQPKIGEPEEAGKNKRRLNLPAAKNRYPILYGESYVLSIISSYAQLHRCTFDEDGNPSVVALDSTNFNVRLDETGEANFELRCDRENAQIALYVDGRFIAQWTDRDGYAGTGTHLAFASSAISARLRISEVIVSSWNGMVDSALSMESKDRDVILLTNGTDRFSGSVTAIENGHLMVKGTFAEMNIPLSNVQEVRFATEENKPAPNAHSDEAARLLLYPVGRITVIPTRSTKGSIVCRFMGHEELPIDLKLINVIEFRFGKSALDAWNEDF